MTAKLFERLVTGVILLNVAVVLAGLVAGEDLERWLEATHNAILAVFIAELAVHLRTHGLRFLRTPWGAFDATLIALSLLPALGLDTSLLRLGRAARVAHLLRHVSGLRVLRLRLLRPNASAVKLAAAGCVLAAAFVVVMGASPSARADDGDDDTTEICGALHMRLSPDDIAERLGGSDQRYFNYWRAWRTVGPTVNGGECG